MFGLAAFGPIGILAAVVGTVGVAAYGAFKDDEYETTHSNKNEREAEAKENSNQTINQKIYNDITRYKKNQKKRLKDKYNADIEFSPDHQGFSGDYKGFARERINSVNVPFLVGIVLANKFNSNAEEKKSPEEKNRITVLSKNNSTNSILTLENETDEILKLIRKLEGLRDETIT